jgi:hypothetical protein
VGLSDLETHSGIGDEISSVPELSFLDDGYLVAVLAISALSTVLDVLCCNY